MARIAFKENLSAAVALDLKPRRALSHSGYISQGKIFCQNALGNDDWKATLAAKGVSGNDLAATLAGFQNLQTLSDKLAQKTGAAQQATQDRNAAWQELKLWISDFRAVAKIALRETPQACEQLGIKAR